MTTNLLRICYAVLFSIKSIHAAEPDDCDDFFHSENTYPTLKDYGDTSQLVKLCQNADGEAAVFATLYDYGAKSPLYSVSKLNLDGVTNVKKPDEDRKKILWERFASALCVEGAIAEGPILSEIKTIPEGPEKERCKQRQPWFDLYTRNVNGLTKGHLEPRNTQSSSVLKSETTYTLTNVAPQYTPSNGQSWKNIECLTKKLITTLAPNDDVYVVTGISGYKKNKRNEKIKMKNELRIPDRFWKSVCYPGNWAFHVALDNRNYDGPSTKAEILPHFINIKAALNNYFGPGNTPFGKGCIDQDHDPVIKELTNKWVINRYGLDCGIKN